MTGAGESTAAGESAEAGAPDAAGRASLRIEAPAESRNDEAIDVEVAGADPGETVAFAASLTDDDGVEWSSRATFVADADGAVDLAARAPESGSYEGVDPMGWLWSMAPADDADAWLPSLAADPTVEVTLRAETAGRTAERRIRRVLYDPAIEAREVDAHGLVGTLYLPPGEGPHPPALDLHGSGGRMGAGTARLLATHGYATLAVEYHGDPDPIPDEGGGIELNYFDRLVEWLRDRPAVRAGPVGLVGVSRGAELALVLGARREWVGAVVSYAGSGVAWDSPSGDPGWIDNGEPVAHLEGKDTPGETVAAGLADEPVEAATPAVEATGGPVLLLSGGDDEVWPSRRLSGIAVERLERADFDHEYDHLTYDGVGHFVGVPYTPLGGTRSAPGGGTPAPTARAAEDSWPVVLEYLARGVGDRDGGR